jgi:hypothetical protein
MTTNTINWEAAARVAGRLGAHTRELVAGQDADEVREWAQQLCRQQGGDGGPRAASYYELAVLLGQSSPPAVRPKENEDKLAWLSAQLRNIETQLETIRAVTVEAEAKAKEAKPDE